MSGNPERLVEELTRNHRHIAVLAAHDVLHDWTLAEDAAQLAFLLILNRLRSGDEALLDRPEATVRRNARWAAMKIRSARLHSENAEDRCGRGTPVDDTGPWSSIEARFACEAILESLPEHYREAIQLRFFRQLPDADAATLLQVTLRAYRRRLDRALVLARSVAGEIGLRGAAAAIGVLQGLRGVLYRLRHLGDLGVAWGNPVATATALVVIAMSPVGPLVEATTAPHGSPGPQAAAGLAPQSDAVPLARSAVSAAAQGRSSAAIIPAPVADAAPHGVTAAEETPTDTSFYSAAAAPSPSGGGSGGGSVVAIGWGNACACNVIFESRDGWRTWRAGAGPQPGQANRETQVALPPDYPNDPRIFLGWPAAGYLPDTTWDMESPGFDADFVALPVIGDITMPPSFEQDGGFFVATPGGMELFSLSGYTVSAERSRPVVFDPPTMDSQVLAEPAEGSNSAFALVGTDGDITNVGSGGNGPVPSVAIGGVPELYGCSGTRCNGVSASPTPRASGLAVSPNYATDHALAVYGAPDDVYLSRDAGRSFALLPAPGGVMRWLSVTSVGGTVVVWAMVGKSSGWTIVRWVEGTGWRVVSPPAWHAGTRSPVHPLVLGAGRMVLFADGDGARCTADGGQTWAEVCPA